MCFFTFYMGEKKTGTPPQFSCSQQNKYLVYLELIVKNEKKNHLCFSAKATSGYAMQFPDEHRKLEGDLMAN